MDYKELNEILGNLSQVMYSLEEQYIENEGEVTHQTEEMEQIISDLRNLLTTEGIDMLGAWLKAKEDRKKALKAEKDYISRQINATDDSIDFIKAKIHEVLKAIGQEKVKGSRGYSFSVTTSVKSEVNKEELKSRYAKPVEDAIRAAGIPEYIGVTLTASCQRAKDLGVKEEDVWIFSTSESPSVRFTKPRASKEE